uniref:LysM domain-containing protein n=1 Tax=Prevotella sp. GTC17259 TaxID=3236795 RepID=A0AB33J709_9BACT
MKYLIRYASFILFLFFALSAVGQTTKWRDMYKVKKKDTLFGIAKEYGISIPELMNANPEMKLEGYSLKKGDYIFIPFSAPETTPAKPVQPAAPAKPAEKQAAGRTVKIGVMLPLHDVDGDGRRMVEYYRGILMACEKLKKEGVSTSIHSWNVPIDADIRTVLLDDNARKCDLIFGPLYTKQLKTLAEFCTRNDIKLVVPFSISGNDIEAYKQIYQVYQSPTKQNDAAIKAFLERFPHHHAIFIDCNDTTSRKGIFTFGLRKQLEQRGTKYSITNLKSSEEMFAKAFSRTEPNIVILNTGRSPELRVAFAKLDGLSVSYPQIKISMFGYTEWLMYVEYNLPSFYKYDTYIPTAFYYNPVDAQTREITNSYARWFQVGMQNALPRFGLTGYDHASYFIRGVWRYGKSFVGSKSQHVYKPIQTPLYFNKVGNGGYQNENFQLIHYTVNQTIESINY